MGEDPLMTAAALERKAFLDLANASHDELVAKAAAFELPMNIYED